MSEDAWDLEMEQDAASGALRRAQERLSNEGPWDTDAPRRLARIAERHTVAASLYVPGVHEVTVKADGSITAIIDGDSLATVQAIFSGVAVLRVVDGSTLDAAGKADATCEVDLPHLPLIP